VSPDDRSVHGTGGALCSVGEAAPAPSHATCLPNGWLRRRRAISAVNMHKPLVSMKTDLGIDACSIYIVHHVQTRAIANKRLSQESGRFSALEEFKL